MTNLGQDWKATLPLIQVEGLDKDDLLSKLFAQLWLRGYQWMPRKKEWIKAKHPLNERIKNMVDARSRTGQCVLCESPALHLEIEIDRRKIQLCQYCWIFNDWL